MLKELCHRCGHKTLAVLQISVDVLDLADVVIADQNAASKYARFFESPQGLDHLEEDYVFARDWGDQTADQIDYWRRKSRRSAEVLVPDGVAATHVVGAYVSCEDSQARCVRRGLALELTIDADLLFET